MADGTPYELRSIHIEATGIAEISVNEALAAAPPEIASRVSSYGSAGLRYLFVAPGVADAHMHIVDVSESLVYLYPFEAAEGTPGAHSTEGVWWRHRPTSGGFIGIANTTSGPREVHLTVMGSQGTQVETPTITVGPYATEFVDLASLLSLLPARERQQGGIRVDYSGGMGDVIVLGGIEDRLQGYSATIPFFQSDAELDNSAPRTYASTGIPAGPADETQGFPKGTRFQPYAVLRNSSPSALRVQPTVYYTRNGQANSYGLAPQNLAPGETRRITAEELLPPGIFADSGGNITLTLGFLGRYSDLAVATGAIDQTGRYSMTVPVSGVAESLAKDLPVWRVSGDFDSTVSVWNPLDMPQDFVATFTYEGGTGHYLLPVHLKPKASTTISVRNVIGAQQPDSEGNVIPTYVSQGSARLAGLAGPRQRITAIVNGALLNGRTGTCGPVCIECFGFILKVLDPNPFSLGLASSGQARAMVTYSDGTTYDHTADSNWSSGDTSIATVQTQGQPNPGMETGMGLGSVTISASFEDTREGVQCVPIPVCAVAVFIASGGTNVNPVITSITPSRGLIGNTTMVEIRGNGFGSNPVVQAGSGITVNITEKSNTLIKANFVVATNAPTGNHSVTVKETASGRTSNSVNFFVQVPTSLAVVSASLADPGFQCSSSEHGANASIRYQVLDQSGQNPIRSSAMVVQEKITNFVINGVAQPDPAPNWQDIGPSGHPGSSRFSDADGKFFDAPLGVCANFAIVETATQQISVLVGATRYPSAGALRTNGLQFTGLSAGHGRVCNGSGSNCTGADFDVSR